MESKNQGIVMKKITIVTGATGGIGSLLCDNLASEQRNRLLLSRDTTKLSGLKTKLEAKYDTTVLLQKVDFESKKDILEFDSFIHSIDFSIEGLVVIPAPPVKGSDCFPDDDTWNYIFNRDFVNPLSIIKSSISKMTDDAKIVYVSGVSSKQIFPMYSIGSVIRSAWVAQVKAIAFKYGEKGIRINTVSL